MSDPVVVCNFEMSGEKNDLSGTFMRADFFKANSDNYEIKAVLNQKSAKDSFLII